MTVISFVVFNLGTDLQRPDKERLDEQEIKGRIDTIQTTALLEWDRIFTRDMKTNFLSDFSEKTFKLKLMGKTHIE